MNSAAQPSISSCTSLCLIIAAFRAWTTCGCTGVEWMKMDNCRGSQSFSSIFRLTSLNNRDDGLPRFPSACPTRMIPPEPKVPFELHRPRPTVWINMNSTNTSERELIVLDDAEKADIHAPGAEKGHVEEELADTLKASSDEIPDGGFFAWLQVAGAFCIFFNTWFVHDVRPCQKSYDPFPKLTNMPTHPGE